MGTGPQSPPPALRKRRDFVRVQRGGKRFKDEHVALMVAPNPAGGERGRVGYTVSRKVSKLSVVRNRVRRRLREIVRLSSHPPRPGFDYVVVAFPSCTNTSFQTLREELTCLLEQAERWASDKPC